MIIKFRFEGTQPLMLNNAQTVNPFNEYTKKLKPLTAKRNKTEEDDLEICRLKFNASLYFDNNGRYIIPANNVWKSICTAAKELKMGPRFEKSFMVYQDSLLDFPEKDMTPDELWKEGSHVDIRDCSVKKNRINACRAIFTQWAIDVECMFDESQINKEDVLHVVNIAGLRYGIGTYRLKFGRFKATEIK